MEKQKKETNEVITKPLVTIHAEEFMHFLDGSSMTYDEKVMLIQSYWNFFFEFTSIPWNAHPVQQALDTQEACGKLSEISRETGTDGRNAVYCLDREFIEKFDAAAGLETDREEKGVGP